MAPFVSGPTEAWAAPGACLSCRIRANRQLTIATASSWHRGKHCWMASSSFLACAFQLQPHPICWLTGQRTTLSHLNTCNTPRPNPAPHLYRDLTKLTYNSHVSAISRSRESRKSPLVTQSIQSLQTSGRRAAVAQPQLRIIMHHQYTTPLNQKHPRVSDPGKEATRKLLTSRARVLRQPDKKTPSDPGRLTARGR